MPEQSIRIQGPDGNGIYGRHRTTGSKKLVLHVHGMTHHAGHLLEVTSSEYFGAHGFDHYRMSLYDRFSDSRKLSNSTLTSHQKDIQATLDHFHGAYDEIYMTAHSLGGLTTVLLNPKGVKAISLWDPSFDVTTFWATGPYLLHIPERKQYQLDYGNAFVISEELVEEIKRYPDAECLNLAKNITTPVQMVIPQESIFLARAFSH